MDESNLDNEIKDKISEKVIQEDLYGLNNIVQIVVESDDGDTSTAQSSSQMDSESSNLSWDRGSFLPSGSQAGETVSEDLGKVSTSRLSIEKNEEAINSTADACSGGNSSSCSSPLPTPTPASFSTTSTSTLPWGVRKEKLLFPAGIYIDPDVKPGEFVMRTLFAEFTVLVEKKLDVVMSEPLERPLSKSLQRGEDPVFDQLLSAFGSVAEHCLPSLLRTLFAWYERQGLDSGFSEHKQRIDIKGKGDQPERTEKDYLLERRDLAVEFIFCLVLIEVLRQLPVHPGHDGLVNYIENLAFKHFRFREGVQSSLNSGNINMIADLYAEVIGALAQSRFQSVKKRFMNELKELRSKEPSPFTTQSIISLLMGMKFFKIKMVPIEEFEASFQFMQECAQYFLEAKDKDVKHALAGLFVETLVPVAAAVKNEVNVPVLKNFVEMLYSQTLDMSTKKKHCLALFPLVTCLLCVSHKHFFLQNWHYFLAMCLSHLKNRDPKMCRVALESLYRLLWVYMIRIKCESNTATQSRLHSIVNSLFPKGSKAVMPRETPLNIFVKIIQFIAQERLDFAMKEIVFDLLSVGRPIKIIMAPERMSIGLRAFLVVADSLQQKEGDPPMPRTVGVLPSGNTLRVKKTFLNKMLTEDTAKSIGISSYYPYVRKAFDDIIRALDIQFGRPLMMTNMQNVNKEPDDMITGERKPKIDLFRTCVAAIPRLMPDGTSRHDLVDLLARLTVHLDEELRGLAFQSLQNIIVDFPDWREDVINGFVQLILKEVNDTFPVLLDNGLRMLLQLLTTWRNSITGVTQGRKDSLEVVPCFQLGQRSEPSVNVLRFVEGFALVMLCNCRPCPRRLAVHILKEVKSIFKFITPKNKEEELAVVDVIDKICPVIVERLLPLMPATEKAAMSSVNIDLQWLSERSSSIWTSCYHDSCGENTKLLTHTLGGVDAWYLCLAGFLEREHLITKSPAAIQHSWPILFTRLNALFSFIDPNPINDNRASLLRSATTPRKPANERDIYLGLWRNYTMFGCRVIPPNSHLVMRCASPDLSLSSSPDSLTSDRSENRSPNSSTVSTTAFYKLIVPLLRCESSDIRDSAVLALGRINQDALRDLMEELVVYIKEAIDRKQENVRRRRRRDTLRAQLARVFELIAELGTFGISLSDRENPALHPTFVDYIDGARQYLECEQEKDLPIIQEIKGHFCNFIRKLIKSFPLESRSSLLSRELRHNLFNLFGSWSGKNGITTSCAEKKVLTEDFYTDFEYSAMQAMSAVLCCGPAFEAAGLADDGYIYYWLRMLLSSKDSKIYQLGVETVILLLDFNPDISTLLDWVVDCCYTGSVEVADACFTAIATVFSAREYPCDHYTAIINVALMQTGCPRANIHEMALLLLQILDKRFFGSTIPVVAESDGYSDDDEAHMQEHTLDTLLSSTYSCSQMFLSKQLAHLHPEITMPMFSEITHRFQTARPSVRQNLLQYLLPWLYNMELVDPHIPPCNPLSHFLNRMQEFFPNEACKPSFRKEGWGSAEATEMVLNNLFYITAKFGDDHPREIEDLWTALFGCWPGNLRVTLRYLFIVSGMAPNELLNSAKRVVLFMGRSRSERLVDELMNELQTVESMNCVIERTETPPFFRVTSMRKASSHSDTTSSGTQVDITSRTDIPVEEGTIHTKRHSAEDSSVKDGNIKPNLSGHGSLRSTCSMSSTASCKADGRMGVDVSQDMVDDNFVVLRRQTEEKADTPLPHPLPMPEYGGYFAPLTEFLPDSSQPISGFHRCNLAVMFLTDVVVDGLDIDWSVHVPLMLHIIFLGLDNSRPLVYEHCKKLLVNILIVLSAHDDHLMIARILLNNKTRQLGYGIVPPNLPVISCSFTDPGLDIETVASHDQFLRNTTSTKSNTSEVGNISSSENLDDASEASNSTTVTITLNSLGGSETADKDNPLSADVKTEDVIKAVVNFIASRKSLPMWSYEDITSKVWSIRSAEQLATFLRYILAVFKDSLPHARIEERWAQIALQLALSCSSRHYAGRSLQIFRALGVPVTPRMLTEILSRLVETVAEQGEDMQGYVTEIMLTLEAAVDSLDSDFHPIDFVKELFKSTPNLNKDNRKSAPSLPASQSYHGQSPQPGHIRSTSYSVTFSTRKNMGSPTTDAKLMEVRNRSSTDVDSRAKSTNLSRSRSAQSLKLVADQSTLDDKMTVLSQLFWIAVSLLESDYEYEFLLAMRLLEKLLKRLPLDRPDCREKVDKLHMQLKWTNFPGVHALLLKGLTSPSTYEPTLSLLSKLTTMLDVPVVDPTQTMGFPYNVIALLPYMLQNYEDPSTICINSAENIAHVCLEKSKKLENLATVMTLYSRRTFSKESFQWTKCVVKYLFDSYAHYGLGMMSFLVEVLEKGPVCAQTAVLNIIHCMLHYLDLSIAAAQPINADLLKVIAKYVEGFHWKEALKILKLAVTRSSTLVAPPSSTSTNFPTYFSDTTSLGSLTSFAEAEVFTKKELPGRTMEFSFDLSQTPIIGRRYQIKQNDRDDLNSSPRSNLSSGISQITENYFPSPQRSITLTQSTVVDSTPVCSWKRPWLSQARTRECLVNLLTSCGQRVGLPKSPSVIFSQSSDIVERQSSKCSSTEEVSVVNNDMSLDSKLDDTTATTETGKFGDFGVFKDFDFLEYELESQEGESIDNFNWGVRRSLSNLEGNEPSSLLGGSLKGSAPSLLARKEESSDDEMTSNSPVEFTREEMTPSNIGLIYPSSIPLMDREHHRSSPTSGSSHSICSDTELGDLHTSSNSAHFSNLSGGHISSSGNDSDIAWRQYFHNIISDTSGSLVPLSYILFTKAFKDLRQKVSVITQECCKVLAALATPPSVMGQFMTMLEALKAVECPQVHIDAEAVIVCRLVEKLKFCVLELQEHFDTFAEKKEHTLECLDGIHGTLKLQSLNESSEVPLEEQQLDLCRCLFKLHFQLLLLFDNFCKMVGLLTSAVKQSQVTDMSREVANMRAELIGASEESDNDLLVPETNEKERSRREIDHMLLDFLHTKKWSKAVRLFQNSRNLFPNDSLGSHDDDDVDIILSIYCKYLCEKRTGVLIITHMDQNLSEVSSHLMEVNVQLSACVNSLPIRAEKERPETTIRKTEC
ncbi:hypothetical protein CHUAL_001566 [Chamberlinius hualienensis]